MAFTEIMADFPEGWSNVGNIYLSRDLKKWIIGRQKKAKHSTVSRAAVEILNEWFGIKSSVKRGRFQRIVKPFPQKFTLKLGPEDYDLKTTLDKIINPYIGVLNSKSGTVATILHDAYVYGTQANKNKGMLRNARI